MIGCVAAQDSLTRQQIDSSLVKTRREVVSRKIDSRQLSRLGASSVADALKYCPGIKVRDYGGVGGIKTVDVRSLGSASNAVFYDGIKITNTQNATVDIGRFSADDVDNIYVCYGSRGADLQTATDYASASSIYMFSKSPVLMPGKRLAGALRLNTGSFGTVNPSASLTARLGSATTSAKLNFLSTDGTYRAEYSTHDYDTTFTRRNADVKTLVYEQNLNLPLFGGKLGAKAYAYMSDRGLPGPAITRASSRYDTQERQNEHSLFLQSSYSAEKGNFSFLANAKYSNDFLHYSSGHEKNAAAPEVENSYRQQEVYASVASCYSLSSLRFSAAVDEHFSTLDCDVKGFTHVSRYNTLASLAASYSHSAFSARGALLFNHILDRKDASSNVRFRTMADIYLGYSITSSLSLSGFVKSSFRMPTFNDLYYTSVGYSKLSPESSCQVALGLTYNSRHVTLKADGYVMRVRDKIVAVPTFSQFRWTMLNYGRVHGSGVNITAITALEAGKVKLEGSASVTAELSRDFTDPLSSWYKGQIAYTPPFSGSGSVSASLGTWKLSVAALACGDRWKNVYNSEQNFMPGWYTLDSGLAKIFQIGDICYNVVFQVNNILNRRYEIVHLYPMPGTNAFLKIKIEF